MAEFRPYIGKLAGKRNRGAEYVHGMPYQDVSQVDCGKLHLVFHFSVVLMEEGDLASMFARLETFLFL